MNDAHAGLPWAARVIFWSAAGVAVAIGGSIERGRDVHRDRVHGVRDRGVAGGTYPGLAGGGGGAGPDWCAGGRAGSDREIRRTTLTKETR